MRRDHTNKINWNVATGIRDQMFMYRKSTFYISFIESLATAKIRLFIVEVLTFSFYSVNEIQTQINGHSDHCIRGRQQQLIENEATKQFVEIREKLTMEICVLIQANKRLP